MIKRLIALACAFALACVPVAFANQSNLWSPTTGTVSGLQLTTNFNNALSALASCNSGATAPANDQSAAAVFGQFWCDTSTTPIDIVKQYDGTQWLIIGYLDTSNHRWLPVIGGGTASLASASSVDLCSTKEDYITITGTTTITSFASGCQTGQWKVIKFSGALTLTHASSLFLPNNASNVTTAANDSMLAVYTGGGNWVIPSYVKADGTALNASATFAGAVSFNGPITVTLGVSTNNWNPTGLATANVIRLTCSASPVNITGLTAPGTDGKVIIVDNVGATNNCTLTSQDTNSTAGNRFAFDRAIDVRPGRSITIKYDITAARWRLWQELPPQTIAGGFKNLKIVNGGTPNNQLAITADELTVEDTNGGAARLSSVNCTADITSSGAGGLDTGTVAQNTGYYLWVIYNPTTNAQSCMFSLQSAFGSITLPSGYTFAARVGWDFVENLVGKRLNRIQCYGRDCQYVVTASSATAAMPIAATGAAGSTTIPTWVSVSLSTMVPSTASRVRISAQLAAGSAQLIVAPNNSYGAYTSVTNPPFMTVATSATSPDTQAFGDMLLESSSIFWANSNAASIVFVNGWQDNF